MLSVSLDTQNDIKRFIAGKAGVAALFTALLEFRLGNWNRSS